MTVEKYEIIGKEADVAEWWKLADKAASDTNCILSEDYGGSDIGDIIHAMRVLSRLTESANLETDSQFVTVREGIFLAIPGKEEVIDKEGDVFTWKCHRKSYMGIEFWYNDDFKYKEQAKEELKELEGAA